MTEGHSFNSLILMLERLYLAERTGGRGASSEIIGLVKKTGELWGVPGAGEPRLDPDNGFQERSYFRLTEGS